MIITGGKVLIDNRFVEVDIRIKKGLIEKIDNKISARCGEDIIDASNKYVLPGFIDIHTHLDDTIGKYILADDFYSGSIIAALNGITSIYNFVTERKDRPLKYSIEEFLKKGEKSIVNYGFHLTPIYLSNKSIDYIKSLIDNGFSSFKFYTTYKNAGIYLPYEEITNFVNKVKSDKTLFLVHCEDEEILSRYYCYQYSTPFDHYIFRPKEAEIAAIEKIIEISRTTKGRFHIVHCSTPQGADIVNKAKTYTKITLETCPQYLLLNNKKLKGRNGHRFFCTPPLRKDEDVKLMKQMAQKGIFDIFTTDHAPFNKADKDENRDNLRMVPNGLAGLGALVHTTYKILCENSSNPLIELSRRLSENPAKIMNLFPERGIIKEGSIADIAILIEGRRRCRIIPTLSDAYHPYEKLTSNLKIDYVIINGVVIVKGGKIIPTQQKGRCLNVKSKGF